LLWNCVGLNPSELAIGLDHGGGIGGVLRRRHRLLDPYQPAGAEQNSVTMNAAAIVCARLVLIVMHVPHAPAMLEQTGTAASRRIGGPRRHSSRKSSEKFNHFNILRMLLQITCN